MQTDCAWNADGRTDGRKGFIQKVVTKDEKLGIKDEKIGGNDEQVTKIP